MPNYQLFTFNGSVKKLLNGNYRRAIQNKLLED